jgi:hypothetical protein
MNKNLFIPKIVPPRKEEKEQKKENINLFILGIIRIIGMFFIGK